MFWKETIISKKIMYDNFCTVFIENNERWKVDFNAITKTRKGNSELTNATN